MVWLITIFLHNFALYLIESNGNSKNVWKGCINWIKKYVEENPLSIILNEISYKLPKSWTSI